MLGHCKKDHLLCSEILKALKTVQGTKWSFCAEYLKVKKNAITVRRYSGLRCLYGILPPWRAMQDSIHRFILCTTLSSSCRGNLSHPSVNARMRMSLFIEGQSDLENVPAIQGVEYPRSLHTAGQRVFDDMLRCRP
jgi:hypothetical protein